MVEHDAQEFATALATLAEGLDKTLTRTQIEFYFEVLRNFELPEIKQAIVQAGRECRFFPKPAELIEFIEGSKDGQAGKAWALLVEAARKGGQYASLWMEDFALAAAFRRTFPSWIEFCQELPPVSDPMHASWFNRFRSAYTDAKRSLAQEDRYFIGWHEANNRNSSATWRTIGAAESEPVFFQGVTVIGRENVFSSRLPFSRLTGALMPHALHLLASGEAKPALAMATPLPAARMIEGEVDPVAVQSQIKQLSAGGMQ